MYRRKKSLPPPTSSKNGFPTLPQIFPTEAGLGCGSGSRGELERNGLLTTVSPARTDISGYCSFVYSALASFRMGMSGSASFQSMRKSRTWR